MSNVNNHLDTHDENNVKKIIPSFIEEQSINTPSQVLSILKEQFPIEGGGLQEIKISSNLVAKREILQEWYKNGPDYLTGQNISGQSIVKQMMIHGNFRKSWQKYVKSISGKVWEKLGYRFPYHIKGIVDNTGHTQLSKKAVLEFFGDFDFEDIRPFMHTHKRIIKETEPDLYNNNISKNRPLNNFDPIYVENMQKWYHIGYIDPQTQQHITGRSILLKCIKSGNYTKSFFQYTQSLDEKHMKVLGFHFRSSIETIFSLMGILGYGLKLEILIKALGETDVESMMKHVPKGHRFNILTPIEYFNKLENWYYNGYMSDNSKVVTGRDIIIECIQSKGGYGKNFRKYANSLSSEESKNIGIHFHRSLRSIFIYLGKDPNSNILDLILMLGESKPEDIIKYLRRPLRATKTKNAENIFKKSKPIFGEKIPENLRYGLRQCYLKIQKNMKDIVDIKEDDIGILSQNGNYYITFRTKKLIEIGREYQGSLNLFIEEANTLVLDFRNRMLPKNAKKIHYINFSLKLPDMNGNYFS